jgi:outer membrane protein TolC
VGVARAAYYPNITLSASGGFESTSITTWFNGPAGFITAGADALVTVFDVGRRRAINDQAKAAYQQSVANYQQTVLTGFQEVEDSLAALRILEDEAKVESVAVAAAEHSLALSTNRYKGGVANYLEVTTAQTAALIDERTAVDIAGRRMASSVSLIKALGGGWSTASLPTVQKDMHPQTSNGQ